MKLIPTWHGRIIFDIEREDNFQYKDRRSKEFRREYKIELEQHDDKTFAAYYPKSILNQIQLLNKFGDFIHSNNDTITKTLFYEVDENFAFEKILNRKEIADSINRDYRLLEQYITDEEEKEELYGRLKIICASESKFQRHILDDTITIHYNYGLEIERGYYFNLHEESKTKKFLKKILPNSKYILKRVNWMRHSISNEFIQIEYLKGIENMTSGFKPDWDRIEEEFGDGKFQIMNHPNLTLNHEIYLYNSQNMILELYNKHHVIDSPIMRKDVRHKITQSDI